MRTTFIETLKELARQDERVFLLTADMGYSVFETFREEFPDRFLNTGIAEQNTIGIAAGLASRGKIVFVYSIIPFVTMRCFEQIRLDLAYNKSNVKIVGVGAGFTYGSLGSSHHALEDISIMRSLPNMTVLCPGDPIEARELIKQSYEHTGPVYIRLGKNGEPKIHPEDKKIPLGKAIEISAGDDLILITTTLCLDFLFCVFFRIRNCEVVFLQCINFYKSANTLHGLKTQGYGIKLFLPGQLIKCIL